MGRHLGGFILGNRQSVLYKQARPWTLNILCRDSKCSHLSGFWLKTRLVHLPPCCTSALEASQALHTGQATYTSSSSTKHHHAHRTQCDFSPALMCLIFHNFLSDLTSWTFGLFLVRQASICTGAFAPTRPMPVISSHQTFTWFTP